MRALTSACCCVDSRSGGLRPHLCGRETRDGTGVCPSSPDKLRQQPASKRRSQLLVEPLSARELDGVRLLGTDLDGPDVARQLLVSLSTLRTHTRSIYSKLGVNSRAAAVSRADELNLLDRTARPNLST